MDLRHLFLRYSFVVNFALLFILAWVGAGLVNQGVAGYVRKDQSVPVKMDALPESAPAFSANPDAISSRDLFRVGPAPAEVAPGDTGATGPSQTQLRLKLLGVMFFGEGNPRNIATIQNLSDQKADVYVPGSVVQEGVKLAEVWVDRVILDRGNGIMEELLFGEPGAASPPPSPEGRPRRGGQSESGWSGPSGIEQVSETEFVVERSAIERALGNMTSIMTDARIIPNYSPARDGEERRIEGFRIFRIKPNSVFKALGLNDGDVIKSINGEEMDSLEKGLGLLKGLSSQSQFTIQLERQRDPRTHNYRVQ